jgi:small-conductance mechanosensitive channel
MNFPPGGKFIWEGKSMMAVAANIGWAVVFSIIGGLVGIILVMFATLVIPKLLDRLTPTIDEDKEIARGNRAVAEYFGRIVSACIIGVSIIVAAAILGGILAGLGF